MNPSIDPDLSVEPSVIRRLTEEQKERLSKLLDAYLLQLEEGLVPDASKLVAENQDLAEALNSYLMHLKALHDVAAGFSDASSHESDANDDADSERLGDFSLIREIGRGGMGVVYEARQISLDRRVAIKVLPFASVLDSKQIARFKNEAQAAAQVQHPNIVPVHAVGHDRGVHYYAMRFVEGLPLDRVVTRLSKHNGPVAETAAMTHVEATGRASPTVDINDTIAWSGVEDKRADTAPETDAVVPAESHRQTKPDQPLDATLDGRAFEDGKTARSRPERDEADVGSSASPATPASLDLGQESSRPKLVKEAESVLKSGDEAPGTFEVARSSHLERYSTTSREYFREVARLGVQAGRALHAAHEYGIVHRDIKPSNLMVDDSGKLWVTDFGLARFQTDASLTKTGDLLGTLRYMSPEQATGKNAFVDHRTDVYSLAATLYELLTFRAAFPGDNNPALLRQIESSDPDPPRSLRREVPVDLETVVLKAMSKSRDDRYATAADFADDLQRVIDGKQTVARPLTWIDRAGQWARRRQRLVISVAAVSVGLALILGLSVLLVRNAKHESDRHLADATRHLERSREAVEDLGLQMAEELRHIPGAARLQKEVLSRSLAYYQEIAQDRSDDPSLQADIALAHSKIGAIYERLDEHEQAIEAYQESLDLFAKLQQDDPDNEELQRSIGICHTNLGQVQTELGRNADAAIAFEEALSRLRPLAESTNSSRAIADLARAENNLAKLFVHQGELGEAEVLFRRAIRRLQPQAEINGDDVELVTQLARSCYNLATLLKTSKPSDARTFNQRAMRAYENLPEEVINTPQHVIPLALIYNNQGAILSASKKYADAMQYHERAGDSLRRLLREAPNDLRLKKDLALTLNSLGQVASLAKENVRAQKELSEAVRLQQELVELMPEDIELQHTLGGIYNNLGIALEQANDDERAARAFQAAVAAQRRAASAQPGTLRYTKFLSQHLVNQGRMLRRLGRADQAVQAALERLKLVGNRPSELLPIAEELVLAVERIDEDSNTAADVLNIALKLVRKAIETGQIASVEELPDTMRVLKDLYATQGWPER